MQEIAEMVTGSATMLGILCLCKDLAGARGAASHCDDFASHFWQSFHEALRNAMSRESQAIVTE